MGAIAGYDFPEEDIVIDEEAMGFWEDFKAEERLEKMREERDSQ